MAIYTPDGTLQLLTEGKDGKERQDGVPLSFL